MDSWRGKETPLTNFSPRYLEKYLATTTTDQSRLFLLESHPQQIELPKRWQTVCNQMSPNSPTEEFVVLGTNTIMQNLTMAPAAMAGYETAIDVRLISLERDRLLRDTSANHTVGLIHSHPSDYRMINYMLAVNPDADLAAAFSCHDIFWQLYFGDLVLCIREMDEILLSLATLDTARSAKSYLESGVNSFTEFWANRNNFDYVPTPKGKGELLRPRSNEASLKKLNMDMAWEFRLAVYRGKIDGVLTLEGFNFPEFEDEE